MAKLIKMVREDGKAADVHPDMVDDYIKGGYVKPKARGKVADK